jgi:hypothetical protein
VQDPEFKHHYCKKKKKKKRLKRIIDLNAKTKAIKLLEKTQESSLLPSVRQNLLEYNTRTQTTKGYIIYDSIFAKCS